MKCNAISLLIVFALVGCSGGSGEAANENKTAGSSIELSVPVDRQSTAPSTGIAQPRALSGLPNDRTLISEGAIDPKSAQGAVKAMQHFGLLLEQREFADARVLWSDGGRASGLTEAEFIAAYDKYGEIHSEVGAPGHPEGAAGSIYIEVPFRLYGTLKDGKPFNLVGPITLRRVNDVDVSTGEQRQWHIARSGLKPRP